MTFHITVAYSIAISVVALMGWMSVQNQQSGWRRQHCNGPLDILCLWARANAEMRNALVTTAQPATALVLGNQLFALSAALNRNAGVSPDVLLVPTAVKSEPAHVEQWSTKG